MNLTLSELAELPLRAALVSGDSRVITQTPEWPGDGPGTSTYRARGNRLLVASGDAGEACDAILSRLLDALDAASSRLTGVQSLQVHMLATSLRLVAGRVPDAAGSSDRVVHFARAGIRARTALEVRVDDHEAWALQCPEVAALVLVQLAVNAERHAGASSVVIAQSDQAFHVRWRGSVRAAAVATSRRRRDRQRWGLGFARMAADALGGAVYAPHDAGGGMCESTFELGLGRLALPLAGVRRGVIVKATRAWDEETRLLPGTAIQSDPRLERACALAHQAPGRIIDAGAGWWARASADLVWIAIPADDTADRARDVIDGIAHERALWNGVPEPVRSSIAALAALLGSLMGAPLQRAPALAWTLRMRELAPLFSLPMAIPECAAAGALDPQVTAFLASQVGSAFDVEGDQIRLRVRSDAYADPLLQAFPSLQQSSIPIT